MALADELGAFETATFQVAKVGSKEKAGAAPVGFVELKSSSVKGTSKIVLFGEETLMNDYKVGEFYEMKLTMVKAQPQSFGAEQE